MDVSFNGKVFCHQHVVKSQEHLEKSKRGHTIAGNFLSQENHANIDIPLMMQHNHKGKTTAERNPN